MVNLTNVYLSYTKEYYTLFDISLDVADGKTVIIHGGEESGKSSLLRVIAGFEKPTSGTVTIKGQPSDKVDYKNSCNMGYLPQEGVFKENKTVYENLKLPLKFRKVDKDIAEIRINNAIKTYDLETLKNVRLRDLQAFDRIKVALARFSLRNIELFVVDDVFSTVIGMDNIKKIAKYLNDLIKNNNATAIIACSSQDVVKLFKGEVVRLEQGSITA